ncbi:hypothetical protein B0T16DRAFT_432422 [Cercophora newfieldiana]|uniref:Zn(2)-C6 fungal-type domain-containing protein n=1 Tax=Cercophora newfieldiana TaxID=92897 RepID=A0AA39XU94_9PEZI|nr:hypothetical protein B0T16DRAFT_432422 [Cercophora newfieldiana]
MTHSCRTCAMRKVKCDKAAPTCSTCRKSKLECLYQPLAPRRRKRKLSEDLDQLAPHEKLACYERMLLQLGVLEPKPVATSAPSQQIPLRFVPWGHSQISKTGKLVTDQGRSRYIDSDLWRNLGDEDDEPDVVSEDDEDEHSFQDLEIPAGNFPPDPLTGAFVGATQQSLLQYHPAYEHAMVLWQTYVENVEPIIKVLHVPSAAKLVESIAREPGTARKVDECLVFAIYHFAIFSMTDDECTKKLGQPRAILRRQYHLAARQALVNASFLKTTEMSVLQALVIFLMSCRNVYDPHTFWILTGVAVRIAQRMGIHRDGAKLGLSPFDVQMRRRLFYQLLPLDANASQMSGVGMTMPPDTWDAEPALNINDDQIWPGMTEPPQEQKGATEMMFCLSRFCIGRVLAQAGKRSNGEFQDHDEADRVISKAESEVEEKFIRYCDVTNPLHFLSVGLARCGITAMRLRVRLHKVKYQTATDEERRELMQLAQKIIDTDCSAHSNASLMRRFRWHVGNFFLWGTWDSLVFVLTTLWAKPELFSPTEIKSAWERMDQVYKNHQELLDTRRALHVAFQKLTVKAWEASRDASESSDLIATLRLLRSRRRGGTTENASSASGHLAFAAKDFDASFSEGLACVGSSESDG